ncbi:redoxin domain-containing protein [Klenkia terrae]|uniref:redoxin domain-containing protein n=1 Tax=Klenkia terrae TaxID=1052259 RepID=UPI0036178E76
MKTGDVAPDFELPDQDGTPRRLSTMLQSGPVVLFFYPLASSGGCTTEMCTVRDEASQFAAVGAQRVGISQDSIAKQKAFADGNGFDYPCCPTPTARSAPPTAPTAAGRPRRPSGTPW